MAQMIELGIPEDAPELLQALGRLAIAHGNLEMVQIMCLKKLENLRPQVALENYRRKGAGKIRDCIEKIVNEWASSEEQPRKNVIIEHLRDCRCHSKRRNALVHRFWGKRVDGTWVTSGDGSVWEQTPSLNVINDLVKSILETTSQLNNERFSGGFIHELAERIEKQSNS